MDILNYSLLWHSLGIDEDRREPYRNYFATSPNTTDYPDLVLLVDAGLMRVDKAPKWSCSDLTFRVTEEGKIKALETLPVPPKISRSKMRYQRFLEYGDGFESFLDYCRWDSKQSW
jgi:hypothetical protein